MELQPDICVILWMKISISDVRPRSCTERKPFSSNAALAPGPRMRALAEKTAAAGGGLGGVGLIHVRTGDRLEAAALGCTAGGGACVLESATGTACHTEGASAGAGARGGGGPAIRSDDGPRASGCATSG